MKRRLLNNLKNIPVATSGLALGIAGLGSILGQEIDPCCSLVCASIAAVFLLLVLSKKLTHPAVFWREITHPISGSFIPTFDMALMVLSSVMNNYAPLFSNLLWFFAVLLHIIFASIFFFYRCKDFNLNHMLPSWFVPPIGIVVACVTAHQMMPRLTHGIFYFGLACYVLMLPTMMYRLLFGDKIQDLQLPAFAVIGAPASLCLAGYLTSFAKPNPALAGALLCLSLMMTALVYLSIIRINPLRISFIPIYASFTFPMAIGATAVLKYSYYIGSNSQYASFWYQLGWFEMLLAFIVIAWVFIKMSLLIIRQLFYSVE